MPKLHRYTLASIFLLLVASQAQALRSNYAEVLVENLQIGTEYNMTQLANMPLEITNNSTDPMDLEITAALPDSPRAGFAPIPSLKWITIGKSEAALAVNETLKTDIKIKIPNDKKYLGKKYEVAISTNQVHKGKETKFLNVMFGVKGRLLFTIAPVVQKADKKQASINLNFMVLPERVSLFDVQPGKAVPVETFDHKPITISNMDKEKKDLMLVSIDPKAAGINEDGYEPAPNSAFVTFAQPEVSAAGQTRTAVAMQLLIPDQPEFYGKKYLFLVQVGYKGTVVGGQRQLRILVDTAKPKAAKEEKK